MCGISLIISKNDNNIIKYLINSLSIIQNRGYDSIGITYMNNNEYNIIKFASDNICDSFEIIKKHFTENDIKSSLAIGHTRWATHGSKTENNAHPHISFNKKIILVHNGIINNYNILKEFLISKNYKFQGETDSEIISNYLEYLILNDESCCSNIEKSINKLNSILEGTWALAIVFTDDPLNIYLTRHGSPLVLGYSDNLIICSSETSGFAGLVINYITLNNNDIIKVNKSGYITNNISEYNVNKVNTEDIIDTPYPYEHWTLKEIMDQPYSINNCINNGARILNNTIKLGGLDNLSNIVDINNIKYILFFGCGTSYHATLLTKYYFNNDNINIIIIDACEFNKSDIPKINNKNEKILSVFCSQSGETIDIVNCINICKNKNCITFGIINVVDSLISKLVDCGIYINAGREVAVASTKSFVNTTIILSLFSYYFSEVHTFSRKLESLRLLSNTINKLLYNVSIREEIAELSNFIIDNKINNIFFLGKNNLYPIAKEISLKIKEICYIHAEGYSASSLKHGPFALLDKSNLTILLIDYNDKENLSKLESTYNEILSRNTNIIVISNNNLIKNNITKCKVIVLPSLEYYNEIIFIVALQYLSYCISLEKNINPDKPRNLAKVVTVE